MVPMTKDKRQINQILRVFVMFVPTYSPMGVIDFSAPSVKSPIPTVISAVPKIKEMKMSFGSGVTVMASRRIIVDTGRTEDSDSFIFSVKIVLFPIISVRSSGVISGIVYHK